MDGTKPSPDDEDPPRPLTARPIRLALLAVIVVALVGGTWWLTSSSGPFGDVGPGRSGAGLRFVGLMQIDQRGTAVSQPASAAADPAGDGTAVCLPLSIATTGAFTGPGSEHDISTRDGAQLAVDRHNAANPGCQVLLKPFDTEGDPARAAGTVTKIVEDSYTVGVIGPSSSEEAATMGGLFERVGVPAATPSVARVALSAMGWKSFFRAIANDAVQAVSVANYLKTSIGSKSVCVVDDGAEYSQRFAQAVRDVLGPIARPNCGMSIDNGDAVSAAVQQVATAAPDAVFYAGHPVRAAEFLKQLRGSGVTATFVGGGDAMDREFTNQAGRPAKGSQLACGCAPATGVFADEYVKKLGQDPGPYSAEAYDLATIMLMGIDRGTITRPTLLEFMRHYDGQGVARHYKWTASGELTNPTIWMFQVE